jgi:dolichol-phosphate mannosyltransferase
MRYLTAIPVFNEEKHLQEVLAAAREYAPELLVVNDGSTDGTSRLLGDWPDVRVITHPKNEGYGAALVSAFRCSIEHNYDVLVTIDCDGQHEPKRIPELLEAISDADVVSGSRYLKHFDADSMPPEDRRRINMEITRAINHRFGLELTDGFCGFKAYRTSALRRLDITEPGYAMPLELWVQAARLGLRIKEVPVPLIYLDEKRAFGGSLDDSARRLAHYYEVIARAAARVERADFPVPPHGAGNRSHLRAQCSTAREAAHHAGGPK